MYALAFLVVYPLGRLNKYLRDQENEGDSPFAADRLPKQIIAPTTSRGGRIGS